MKGSDLSHSNLGGDAPVNLTCIFEDGERRHVTVRAAEAARLKDGGSNVTNIRYRLWTWCARRLRKALPWVAGLLIGSLLIPALTKQWSDRQATLAIKRDISRDMYQQSIDAIQQVTNGRVATINDAARREEIRKVLNHWQSAALALDAQFSVYFSRSTAEARWFAYREAVYYFIGLGAPFSHRSTIVPKLRSYLNDTLSQTSAKDDDATDKDWRNVGCGGARRCKFTSPTFQKSLFRVASDIAERRFAVQSALADAHSNGFSAGIRDLIRDTLSPLY